MKAITTKYLPWTNTRPARVKAHDGDGNQITIGYDKLSDGVNTIEGVHRNAAVALCHKMGWDEVNLVGGGVKADTWAWAWDHEGPRAQALKEIRDILEDHPDVARGNSRVHRVYMLAKAHAPKY